MSVVPILFILLLFFIFHLSFSSTIFFYFSHSFLFTHRYFCENVAEAAAPLLFPEALEVLDATTVPLLLKTKNGKITREMK